MIPKHSKYLILLLFIAAIYLIFLLIKPFISILLGSAILAYAFYPVHKKLEDKLKKPKIAAALTTTLILLIIVVPLIFVLNVLTLESISAYQVLKNYDYSSVNMFLDEKFSQFLSEIVNRILSFFVNTSSKVVFSIPTLALNFFLLFFIIYYLLRDSDIIVSHIKNYLFIKNKEVVYNKFDRLTKALIYGTILIAVVQGILGGIGFAIFGIPSPILWGFAMGIASFIPIVGTAIVWAPAAIFKLIQGDIFSGIGLFVFGAIIVGFSDNLIRPYFVSSKAKVHPAIVLLGVLGGLELFGFTGIIIGPLALALALEFIRSRENPQ